jgi:beta-lactamase superfamily II metal-dependent hydrolase
MDGEVLIHFIDVGQGDAVLIQSEHGAVLIDAGENNMAHRVVSYLENLGINTINYLIATHPHSDHIGGLIGVLEMFHVEHLIMPQIAHTSRTFERFLDAIEAKDGLILQKPEAGATFSIPTSPTNPNNTVIFTIIAPNSEGYSNINNYSIALRMVYGSIAFIFTGDAEAISEREMLSAGHNLRANVLHVGHHGSNTSTTQAFLDAVNPSIAIIQLGESNSHGHPHRELIERLEAKNIGIYRTDHHGNIIITTDGNDLRGRWGPSSHSIWGQTAD